MKIIFYQRVLPKYRHDLLIELSESPDVEDLKVVAASGQVKGAQKSYKNDNKIDGFNVHFVKSFNFLFKGKYRSTYIPFYPQSVFQLKSYDVVILEGTTNILNNVIIIPIAWVLRKKIVWWDAGYSEYERSLSRKVKDRILSLFVKMTDYQMAYSTQAKKYLTLYMGAKNCFLNVNTISTKYFVKRKSIYKGFINGKKLDFENNKLNLLYVGAIESRKKIREFIEAVDNECFDFDVTFTIVGDGNGLQELKSLVCKKVDLNIIEPIYEYADLEKHYKSAHYFVLPGEGGLAVIQSMQFGVPVLMCKADGTEDDYIENTIDGYVFQDIDSIVHFLMKRSFSEELYGKVIEKSNEVSSARWINNIIEMVS